MVTAFRKYSITFYLIAWQTVFFAQSSFAKDTLVSSLIEELSSLWDANKNETFNLLVDLENNKRTNLRTNLHSPIINKRVDLLVKRNQTIQKIYKKDLGFSITASYQRNSPTSFLDPEDIVVFRQKAQAGIDWDILKGGILENRRKAKTLNNEIEWLKKSQYAQKSLRPFLITSQQVITNFNARKLTILQKRLELNNKHLELIEKLWALKHITKDNYLKVLQNKTDINGQFELYKSFSEQATKLSLRNNDTLNLPLLDIDFEKLISRIDYAILNSDSVLPNYILENAKREASYLNDVQLKAYARYNYYDVYTKNLPNRSFMSYGLNLSLPLTANQKDKQQLYLLNKQIDNYQQPQTEPGTEYLLLNYYYEYRYKLKKYFNLIEKRNLFAELLRTEKVKQEYYDLEFNPNTALFILDDYWSIAVEMLDLHQDLYKLLINIKEKLPNTEIADFTLPITTKDNIKDSTFLPPPTKAIYIWSKSLTNEASLKLLPDYITLNGFNQVVVSFKYDKTYLKTLNEFVSKIYPNRISLLIGNNKLLKGGISVYLDSLSHAIPLEKVKSIHYDIEPHALDDFKANQEDYFKKYLQLLETGAVFCQEHNLQFEVSIPLHYPDYVLDKIFAVCDKVYLMAYENVDPDFILRKCEEEFKRGKAKVVIALRTKDFNTRANMDVLFKKLEVKNSAYHDFEGLIELDKNASSIKEEN